MMTSVEAWITQAGCELSACLRAVLVALPYGSSFLVASAGFVLIGILAYRWSASKNGDELSVRDALKLLFPADLYRHQSSKVDYWVFPLTIGLPVVLSALGFTALLFTGKSVEAWMLRVFGDSPVTIPDGWLAVALQFTVIFLAVDFANFVYHYLFHKVPFLWRLHRVHHSAEVLTPLTRWRFHPAEVLFDFSFKGPFAGILAGPVMYFCGMKLSAAATALVMAMNLLFETTFYFRHSHVWISYGRIGNHIFSSPCMHQIHHSTLLRHRDRNLALMLPLWDFLFGTLYVPESHEEFPLGIGAEEIGARNPHTTIGQVLIEPVKTSVLPLRRPLRQRHAAIAELPSQACKDELLAQR
jgi:sterol desaturase/sphingolipid hydroxylase (fatty acid hydroxylase superfamily)